MRAGSLRFDCGVQHPPGITAVLLATPPILSSFHLSARNAVWHSATDAPRRPLMAWSLARHAMTYAVRSVAGRPAVNNSPHHPSIVHGAPIRPLTDTTVPETEFPDPYNLGTALLVLRMQYTQDHHEMNTTLRAREPQATAARSKRVQQGATE